MATINLIPNIPVIIGQGVVFGTAILVVNKLILKPYSQLREKRDSLTSGSQDQAKSMFKEIEEKTLEIKEKRSSALEFAAEFRKGEREKALTESGKIVEDAKSKASKEVEGLKTEISSNLKDELSKISSVADEISEKVFAAAVN